LGLDAAFGQVSSTPHAAAKDDIMLQRFQLNICKQPLLLHH
jgi:hypothetical protein